MQLVNSRVPKNKETFEILAIVIYLEYTTKTPCAKYQMIYKNVYRVLFSDNNSNKSCM